MKSLKKTNKRYWSSMYYQMKRTAKGRFHHLEYTGGGLEGPKLEKKHEKTRAEIKRFLANYPDVTSHVRLAVKRRILRVYLWIPQTKKNKQEVNRFFGINY